jgi:hypothetical protein
MKFRRNLPWQSDEARPCENVKKLITGFGVQRPASMVVNDLRKAVIGNLVRGARSMALLWDLLKRAFQSNDDLNDEQNIDCNPETMM